MTQGEILQREAIIARLGSFPSSPPLDAAFGPTSEHAEYTRTLVTYTVEPGERISAWLLRPHGDSPEGGRPGVVAIHQHGGLYYLGKAEPAGLSADTTYHYGLDLCRRGYVVVCPDLLCFEDRRPPEYRRHEHATLRDQNYERFEFTRRILAGSCLQTKYLHDLVRTLDLLADLPDVDSAGLGAIGHSLGGQEALWLAWYDDRVRAAVSSCGFGLVQTLLRDAINHNFALYVPGLLELCDMDALVAGVAPRAFLLTAGEADPIFPIDGVRVIAERAKAAYAEAGTPDAFRSVIFPGGHGFPPDVKDQAFAFLDSVLKRA